jgi:hypothetical protein
LQAKPKARVVITLVDFNMNLNFFFCFKNSKWTWLERPNLNLIVYFVKISIEHELKHIVRTKILPCCFFIINKFRLHLPTKNN